MNMVPGITGLVDKHNRINSSMSTFTTIYYSNGYSTDCTRDHGKVTATECMLYWCIQSLSTEVKSSVLTETSTSPRSMIHNTTQPRREFYLDDNGVRYYVSKDGGFGAQGVESFLMNDIFSAGNATNKYGTNAGASNDIVSILSNKAFDHYGNSKSTGNTTGTAGLSEIVTRVADSMSANIRTAVTYDNTSRPAIGTTWEQETFINVRWPWLILPLLLDVLALVFLVFVVVSTKRSNTQVWKSSQMVTIFHGFTFREQMDMEKAHGMIDMEDVARSIEVRLVPTGEGKRLSKVP